MSAIVLLKIDPSELLEMMVDGSGQELHELKTSSTDSKPTEIILLINYVIDSHPAHITLSGFISNKLYHSYKATSIFFKSLIKDCFIYQIYYQYLILHNKISSNLIAVSYLSYDRRCLSNFIHLIITSLKNTKRRAITQKHT